MLQTTEHDLLRKTVRDFVQREINPHADDWEREGAFPAHQVFRQAGKLGLLGIKYEQRFGGGDLDYSYTLVVAEELGRAHCGGVPLALGVQTDMATPALARHGSDALREAYLRPAIAGEQVACIGVSEPGAGSDVAAIRTRAVRNGDDYIVNGSKMWITNGAQADWMCALVNTSDEAPHRNKSLLIIPLETDGVTRARKLDKLGMRASDTAEIFFEDVRVPGRNLIGEEGQGFRYQMVQFQEERLWAAANMVGLLEQAIGDTVDYTGQRQAFGRSILHNQVVHYRLAELSTEVEALRSLVYRATERYVAGEDVTLLASMAKLKAGRLAREVTDSCLQFWGGMGYVEESRIARQYRDARLMSIGGGADEVMLSIISKLLGIAPRAGRGR